MTAVRAAQNLSPEIVGAMPVVKQLVSDLLTMSRPPTEDLRVLAAELGVHEAAV
ncbi:hypothetical protein [Streptomyces mirabilis]|uniref:hypothetical protein n=1 Tax=Streptomyces mirabilis TaxID=68239 RepID=UPI0033A42914